LTNATRNSQVLGDEGGNRVETGDASCLYAIAGQDNKSFEEASYRVKLIGAVYLYL
jgi:hypothetical protein